MSDYDYDKRGGQREVIERCAFRNERDRRIDVAILFVILSSPPRRDAASPRGTHPGFVGRIR